MVGVLRAEVRQAREAIAPLARPWERTGSVDVEHLLVWAYGVQMVDRFERVGLHAIEAEAAGFEPRGYSGCGVGQLMAIEHMGCRIDAGRVTVTDTCHPAAYAVAQELAQVEHHRTARYHAQAGTRPSEWVPPERFARAVVWVKPWETAQVEYEGPGRKGGHCRVILLWDRQREAWGREQYRVWWQALADLAWRLSARALGFSVTGPAAPAEPWLAAAAGKRAEPSSIVLDLGHPLAGPPGAPSR
jgi:hypothetical protein